MASITTILGTDSVSSSRIVINNNFNALNTELGTVASLLNTTAQTLTLTGEIKGGTLKVFNGSLNTLEVTASDITARVETTFNDKVTLNKGLITTLLDSVTSLPLATAYEASTYVLAAPAFTSSITLAAAEDGQEITFIVSGTPTITGTSATITPVVVFDATNIQGPTVVEVGENGSITFVYNGTTSTFHVVSAMNATVTY